MTPRVTASSGRTIAAKGLQSLGFRGVEIAAQVVLVAVTARFLGPSGRGLYALAGLAAVIFALPLGSAWSILALDLHKGGRELRALLTTALVASVGGGTAIALLVVVGARMLMESWWVVALPAAITPVLLFLTYAQGFYQALGRVVAFHTVRVARIVSPLLFVSAALAAGAGIEAVLVLWAVSFAVLAPPVLVHLVSTAGRPTAPERLGHDVLYAFAGGLRFLPGNAALALDMRVALPVLAAATTTAVVGVYSVAISVAELLRLGSRAIYVGAFAEIGGRDRAAAAALTSRAVRHWVLVALAASVVAIPLCALLLPPVVGPGYEEVPMLLALLVPGAVALCAFPSLTAFFAVQVGRPEAVTVASALLAGTTLAFMLVLVGPFEARGAAVATSIGSLVGVTSLARAFLRSSRTSAARLVPGRSELADYRRLVRALAHRPPAVAGLSGSTGDA